MGKQLSETVKHFRDNMTCAHCGCTFKGTDSQAYHAYYEKCAAYCSKVCRSAAFEHKMRESAVKKGLKPRKGVLSGPCPTCGKMFESRIDKVFCSLECYNKSPQFKEMLQENYRKGNERTQEIWAEKMQRVCPVCGKEYRAHKSKRKFCSHLCYRKFKADLFDAWIANPQHIALPQCYDEFMLQDELPCLIDGCNWKGRHLSVHLNQAHGVLAADFKRAAGFNLKTGLIAPDLAEELSQRRKEGVAVNALWQQKGKGASQSKVRNYRSLEGKEHQYKARLLAGAGPVRTCQGCGVTFQQSTPYGRTLFCTISCRDQHYTDERKRTAKVRVRQPDGTFRWESNGNATTAAPRRAETR